MRRLVRLWRHRDNKLRLERPEDPTTANQWLKLGDCFILLRRGIPERCEACGRIVEFQSMAVAPRPSCGCEQEVLKHRVSK